MEAKQPEFLVEQPSRWQSWRQGLAVLIAGNADAPAFLGRVPTVFGGYPFSTRGKHGRAHLASTLLHVCVVSLALQAPSLSWFGSSEPETPTETVYDIKTVDLARLLPNLRAPGPGGRPGRGTRPDLPPKLGSTAFHPKLTVVSNPINPDNLRQTIIQPTSPPEVKIKTELKLPNVIIPVQVASPQRPVEYRLDAKARASRRRSDTLTQAPDVAARPRDLTVAPSALVNPLPRLAVPPAPPAGAAGTTGSDGTAVAGLGTREWNGNLGALYILSLEPGPMVGSITLPPGNRQGAFSISPAGGEPGSPGGVPGGHPEGGSGGPGTGGDGSVGVGSGGFGGGGPGVSAAAGISVSGGSGGGVGMGGFDTAGPLPARVIASMTYPVDKEVAALRKNSLTVTTGPIGGGGLRVYGVLRGGKVYTNYLAMPGKSWILQYCVAGEGRAQPRRQRRGVVARLTYGLAPPMVDARFDFQRVPVPAEKEGELIILRGIIDEEGIVRDVRVHRGVEPLADQLAVAAFRQWKFRPVLQKDKPVKVEFLLGVPAHIEGHSPDAVPRRAESH